MERCAVLLRGVNVGRGNRIAMADLRDVLAALGCTDVTTHLNSGNALVTAEVDGLARRVEQALPLDVRVVVVRAPELAAAVQGCPWPEVAAAEPKQVHVAYVDRLPGPDALAALDAARGDDEVVVGGRWLWLRYTGRTVDAPLSKALNQPRLGVVVTVRNWTTACALERLSRPG